MIRTIQNDDMQGTAAVVLSALVSACRVTKTELKDQRIALFGVGKLYFPSLSFILRANADE